MWMLCMLMVSCACGALAAPATWLDAGVGTGAAYQPYDYLDDYPVAAAPVAYYAQPASLHYQQPHHVRPYEPEPYYYEPYAPELDPVRVEERMAREAALPVGQEMWYEGEAPEPRWRSNSDDDVNAAFLQNLIIAQMAYDANARRAAAAQRHNDNPSPFARTRDRDEQEYEDEDVRELKALAGKPLYHVAKTEPPKQQQQEPENEYYDYPSDDSFINWNSKRSVNPATTAAPIRDPAAGPGEVFMGRPPAPSNKHQGHLEGQQTHEHFAQGKKMTQLPIQTNKLRERRAPSGIEALKLHLDAQESDSKVSSEAQTAAESLRRLRKRFVSSTADLESQLRGLKRPILT